MNAPGPTFESAANDALAKKCDELEAENTGLKDAFSRGLANKELQVIRAMIKSRVPVGQSADYLDEHDACGAAVSAMLSHLDAINQVFEDYMIESDETLRDVCARLTHANVELRTEIEKCRGTFPKAARHEAAAAIERLMKERDEQQAKRYEAEAEIARIMLANTKREEFPFDIKTPRKLDYTSVLSAAERAAGKVSGPAQAALVALAIELRRGA